MRTLDLSARWPGCDFDAARTMHRDIARKSRQWLGQEIRLGQPVRTHNMPCGRAAGTLRLSLSMPLIVELAALPDPVLDARLDRDMRSEEHTSELQSLMRISYAVLCLNTHNTTVHHQ